MKQSADPQISHHLRYLACPIVGSRRHALLAWLGLADDSTVKAVRLLTLKIRTQPIYQAPHKLALWNYFGSGHPLHPFCLPGANWVALHEPQITSSLAYFLRRSDALTIAAFIKALAPDWEWPDDIRDISAQSEIPTGKGRIDLLVKGRSSKSTMGVVIEAKFRHHAGKNPFPNYRNFASDKWFGGRENEQLNEIAKFIILGIEPCRKTRELTTKDGALWRFVRWSDFLRKFELEVLKLKGHGTYGHPQEYNFIQLRRIIWEMI